MGTDGLGKKLAFAAVAVGAILLVLRIVGGRGAEGIDERGIDRVDTGKSADDEAGEPVETGLERVSTSDDTDDEDDEEPGSDEIAVEATGRFDDLDLFDLVAIAGAAFEAAREEYQNRV